MLNVTIFSCIAAIKSPLIDVIHSLFTGSVKQSFFIVSMTVLLLHDTFVILVVLPHARILDSFNL